MFNDGFCDMCHTWWGHEDLIPAKCKDGLEFMCCYLCQNAIMKMDQTKVQEYIHERVGLKDKEKDKG